MKHYHLLAQNKYNVNKYVYKAITLLLFWLISRVAFINPISRFINHLLIFHSSAELAGFPIPVEGVTLTLYA